MRDRLAVAVLGVAALLTGARTSAPADGDLANYGFTFTPPAPADGAPEILKIELNSDKLHAGGPIAIRQWASIRYASTALTLPK